MRDVDRLREFLQTLPMDSPVRLVLESICGSLPAEVWTGQPGSPEWTSLLARSGESARIANVASVSYDTVVREARESGKIEAKRILDAASEAIRDLWR